MAITPSSGTNNAAYVNVGDDTVRYGADGVYATGFIQSASFRVAGKKITVQSGGSTVAAAYFDEEGRAEVEIDLPLTAPSLSRGDFVTIAGVTNCIVEEFELRWTEGDKGRWRLVAVAHDGISNGA
jgi:hypothetical protein